MSRGRVGLHIVNAFRNAKAPFGWRRGMTRGVADLNAVHRGGAWIDMLCAIDPTLHQGHLYGTALQALTHRDAPEAEAQPAARPGKPNVVRPEEASRERMRHDSGAPASAGRPRVPGLQRAPASTNGPVETAQQAAHAAQTLARLQPQADSALLSRLAGSDAARCRPEHAQGHAASGPEKRAAGVQKANQAQNKLFSADKRPEAAAPSRQTTARADHDWIGRMARRVEKALHSQQPRAAASRKSAPNDGDGLQQAKSLTELWAMALAGTAAPLSLLDGIVQKHGPRHDGGGSAVPRRDGVRQAEDKFSERNKNADALTERPAAGQAGGQHLAPRPRAPKAAPSFGHKYEPPPVSAASVSAAPSASAPVEPPNVTPPLPNLLPRRPFAAAPPPTASEAVRQGAREEQEMSEGEMALLAAKIKQILDEQARRHGIDV